MNILTKFSVPGLVLASVFASGASGALVGCGEDKPAVSPENAGSEADGGSTANAEEPAPKWDSTSSPAPTGSAAASGSDTATTSSTSPAAHRTDVYDKEQTEIALKRAARQAKANCGAATGSDGKAAGPWGTGTVSVVLGHNGHTQGATVGAPFDGTPPGRCVIQAFSNLTFPPWGGQDTTVQWDIEIPQPKK